MEITLDGIKISYERYIGDGTTVLLLHGWGASKAAVQGLFNFISSLGRSVISLDFPFFGASDPPPSSWGVFDYADITHKFMSALDVEKAVIVGHSFGGRIGVILAAEKKAAEKLVLIDSAGLRPRRSIGKRLKVLCYKVKKRFGCAAKNSGSSDYNALPDFMKPVFVRVVNTYLDGIVEKIDVPTLLLWGSEDRDTPLYMAKKFERKIKDSGLVVLEGAGHFSYADRFVQTCAILESFL